MSEEKSKCCGYEIYEEQEVEYDGLGEIIDDEIIFICSGCGMPTEVEEKEEEEGK